MFPWTEVHGYRLIIATRFWPNIATDRVCDSPIAAAGRTPRSGDSKVAARLQPAEKGEMLKSPSR